MPDEALDKPTEAVLRQARDEGPRLHNGAAREFALVTHYAANALFWLEVALLALIPSAAAGMARGFGM